MAFGACTCSYQTIRAIPNRPYPPGSGGQSPQHPLDKPSEGFGPPGQARTTQTTLSSLQPAQSTTDAGRPEPEQQKPLGLNRELDTPVKIKDSTAEKRLKKP